MLSCSTTNLEEALTNTTQGKKTRTLPTTSASKKKNNVKRKKKTQSTNQKSTQSFSSIEMWFPKATMEDQRGEQYVWILKQPKHHSATSWKYQQQSKQRNKIKPLQEEKFSPKPTYP